MQNRISLGINKLNKACRLAYKANPLMEFLFNITAFYYSTPVFYKVSQINQAEYFAEPGDETMRSFTFKKTSGTWIGEGGYTDFQALQIGEQIDKMCQNARMN